MDMATDVPGLVIGPYTGIYGGRHRRSAGITRRVVRRGAAARRAAPSPNSSAVPLLSWFSATRVLNFHGLGILPGVSSRTCSVLRTLVTGERVRTVSNARKAIFWRNFS